MSAVVEPIPAAECFSLMNDAELEAVAADIGTNDLPSAGRHLRRSVLLDGRRRALACERAGVPVPWETVRAVAPGTRRWP